MRRIASSTNVPRDEEFHFKERAAALVTKWQTVIQAAEQEAKGSDGVKQANGTSVEKDSPPSEAKVEAVKSDSKPAVNGTANGTTDAEMTNGDAKPAAEVVADGKDDAMDMSDS